MTETVTVNDPPQCEYTETVSWQRTVVYLRINPRFTKFIWLYSGVSLSLRERPGHSKSLGPTTTPSQIWGVILTGPESAHSSQCHRPQVSAER